MTRRLTLTARRRLATALAFAPVAVMLAGSVEPATAASSGPPTAYWWIAEQGGGGAPAPPDVPAGGLYVSSTAGGATAVSAVRIAVPTGRRLQSLVLHVHHVQTADTFAVDAYDTNGRWTPGDAQPWNDRPTPTVGAAAVHGAVSASATTVTFDLHELDAPVVNLVLLPGINGTAQPTFNATTSPTFDASFEPVKPLDVVLTAPPAQVLGGEAVSQAAAPTRLQRSAPRAAAAPAGALQAPLPATGSVQAPLPAAPVIASPPAAQRPLAAIVLPRGRSTRDTVILAFALADAMVLLMWQARPRPADRQGARISIYDLPATPTSTGGPP